jgi:sialidase-1
MPGLHTNIIAQTAHNFRVSGPTAAFKFTGFPPVSLKAAVNSRYHEQVLLATERKPVMYKILIFASVVSSGLLAGSTEPSGPESAEPVMRLDGAGPQASRDWLLDGARCAIKDGELVLDGSRAVARAFFQPNAWDDVILTARFFVEPAERGVLACGFVVRATDGANYYYVHFDRAQAILCRSDAHNSWNEIKRVSGLDKPAGTWHEGALECRGAVLRVRLNGKILYEASDATLKSGRIGFYASQGTVHVKDIIVRGQAQKVDTPLVLPAPMFSLVCEDAGAGGYEAFPDVCRLRDGRLMCVFYAGYGHVAMPNEQLPKGGRVARVTSADEGRTWSAPATLYDGPDDDRDPSIAQLASGRVICNFFSLRNAPGSSPPWTGLGAWMVASGDGGATWAAPALIAKDYYCSSPVRQLSDGRLILGLYREEGAKSWGAVTISKDDGETWGTPIDIDNGGLQLDAETDIIELENKNLFAAQRGRGPTMGWSVSADGGATWTVSKPFGFPGHCPYLLRTPAGVIVMAHRLPQTSLHFSVDECRTWSENVMVDDVIGAYPSMVNLKDGSSLIVYYEEGAGSSIRAKRFRATNAGIAWLPMEH